MTSVTQTVTNMRKATVRYPTLSAAAALSQLGSCHTQRGSLSCRALTALPLLPFILPDLPLLHALLCLHHRVSALTVACVLCIISSSAASSSVPLVPKGSRASWTGYPLGTGGAQSSHGLDSRCCRVRDIGIASIVDQLRCRSKMYDTSTRSILTPHQSPTLLQLRRVRWLITGQAQRHPVAC